MADLSKWTLFSLLDQDFVDRIKFAIVFGSAGNEALIVTNDNKTYGHGTNNCSCLGNSTNTPALLPKEIDCLNGKEVTTLSYGSGPHVLALLYSGEVYAWGHNAYGQLGIGHCHPAQVPTQVQGLLAGVHVIQIAAGNHHSLALSNAGEIFAWGQNGCGQLGIGSSTPHYTVPKKINNFINHDSIIQIAAGQNTSTCVTRSGAVYTWGQNQFGQLGLGHAVNQSVPMRVHDLKNVVVSQITCGFAHMLCCTDIGTMYAWGSNHCGQLGQTTRSNQLTPIQCRLNEEDEELRIVDVAAIHVCNISVALASNDTVFVWGQVRGQSIHKPTGTPFRSIYDAFGCCATPPVAHKPLHFKKPAQNGLQDSVKAAFDDPKTADVHFKLEGRTIHAHRSLLKIRCHHFNTMFSDRWKENTSSVIEIKHWSYQVYRAFLQYLYTDRVDLLPEHAVGLLDLANAYCETHLVQKCLSLIRRGINVDNALILYAAAAQYNSSELREFCFQFCLNHMTAVIQSEEFMRLDEESIKHFILEASKSNVFRT